MKQLSSDQSLTPYRPTNACSQATGFTRVSIGFRGLLAQATLASNRGSNALPCMSRDEACMEHSTNPKSQSTIDQVKSSTQPPISGS